MTVLFGLKVAGVAAAGSAPPVRADETKAAPSAASKLLEERLTRGKPADAARTASGVVVTPLKPDADTGTALPESFVFADSLIGTTATSQISLDTGFVARPLETRAPRPLARLAQARAAKSVLIKTSVGQPRQHNRPSERVIAKRSPSAKSSHRRVVWLASRAAAPKTASNVVPFPTPAMRFAKAA
ncbi:MAG: hypothetical protein AAGJ70_00195 [Pseudomonadota bacterium]